MPQAVALTLTSRPARFESEDRTLDYEVLVGLSVAHIVEALAFDGWRITRTALPGGRSTTRTIQMERGIATRLYAFAKMCWADGRGGYSSFRLADVALNQEFALPVSTPVMGQLINADRVTPGLACAVVGRNRVPLNGLIGLGAGLGLTYGPRSIGPAVVDIATLMSFVGGAAISTVQGR
jgi:hypothetical protein